MVERGRQSALGSVLARLGVCLLLASTLSGGGAAPPGDDPRCQVAPAGYDGPCHFGALPAFFDDFQYTSGSSTGDISRVGPGDLFGPNRWITLDGEDVSRGWYRYNRNDHPVPATISFEDGVMRLLVPAGTPAEEFERSFIMHTGATFGAGTYHYRVRLSPHWPGQALRQSAWAISPELFVFEQIRDGRIERFAYWSEIDFENQNHFQGSRETGEFVPDYVSIMSVGNHYGLLERSPGYPQPLSASGPAEFMTGRGALARSDSARHARDRSAPLVDSWANRWLDLLINVDPSTRITTYRLRPVGPDQALAAVAERSVPIGAPFYPRHAMHFAFSLHWVDPSGRLNRDFWMEVERVYYSPVAGLTYAEVEAQVSHLRREGGPRVNTTGERLFPDHSAPLELQIAGPDTATCGEQATWRLQVNRAGFYHSTFRMRAVDGHGRSGRWSEIMDEEASMVPRRGTQRIELEASATDRWRDDGMHLDRRTGWEYPREGNETDRARRSVTVTCGG